MSIPNVNLNVGKIEGGIALGDGAVAGGVGAIIINNTIKSDTSGTISTPTPTEKRNDEAKASHGNVRHILRSIRSIVEGTIGSLLADLIRPSP